jgi:hypothetical protein
MNNKWLWLIVGIVLGAYVVPMVRAKTSSGS